MITQILEAKIEDEKLYINGVESPTDDVFILGDAKANSTGFVIFGEKNCLYITNTQPDLQSTVDELINIVDRCISIAGQSVVKQVTGGSGSPAVGVSFPVDEAAGQQLEQIKSTLQEFKLK